MPKSPSPVLSSVERFDDGTRAHGAHIKPTSVAPAIEPGAYYRPAEVFSTSRRRGLLPIGKTRFWTLVSEGRLRLRKIDADSRAGFLKGADLLELMEGGAE